MLARMCSHARHNVVGYLALFVALGGTGYAATGGNFILGQPNEASSETSLTRTGANTGKALQVTNTSTGVGATALGLNVASGHAPFTVNSGTKVTNLNADKLDGIDSGAFQRSGCQPTVAGTGQMVKVGPTCIDKYEASVWSQPNGGTQLTTEAQIDAACPDSGQPSGGANCQSFYARSVAGVEPASEITWFQAQQALANSGKRLPTNAEWQQAVSGTPDSSACNVSTGSVANTGANASCVSRHGAFDMVANLAEWVAEWMPVSDNCQNWGPFSDDQMCLSGASTVSQGPAALFRGGDFFLGAGAGPFAVNAFSRHPQHSLSTLGFRGAR